MNELLKREIEFIRNGGNVKRYHTKHVIHENTVAHHSCGVAFMAYLLCDGLPSMELIMACLSHDLAEQITGDISSPTKRRFPDLARMVQTMESEELDKAGLNFERMLDAHEKVILKIADCLDGMLYCIGEMELGNKSILEVYKRYDSYVSQVAYPLARTGLDPIVGEVFSAIRLLGAEYVV